MGMLGCTWVYKGVEGVYKKGIRGVYKGYTKGVQGFIGYSQDIISSLT